MSRRLCSILAMAILSLTIAVTAGAETLLGTNYIGGSIGYVEYGNEYRDRVFGNGTDMGVVGNINLAESIDLNLSAKYEWTDGDDAGLDTESTLFLAVADLVYFFNTGERLKPYINASLGGVYVEAEASGPGLHAQDDETRLAFGGGGGVEFEAGESVLLRLGLDYLNMDEVENIDLTTSLGFWFTKKILGAVSATYDFDTENSRAGIKLIIKL
ncbi:MAG: outer membrane beta-barrel protein [Thermodesulfobacteriota bacterium]